MLASGSAQQVYAVFAAQAGPRGYVAIDDVDIMCGSTEFGECACNDGYEMLANHTCVLSNDPDGAPELPKLVDTCRRHAPCDQVVNCENGGVDPVCAAGTAYKNAYCAQVNLLNNNNN